MHLLLQHQADDLLQLHVLERREIRRLEASCLLEARLHAADLLALCNFAKIGAPSEYLVAGLRNPYFPENDDGFRFPLARCCDKRTFAVSRCCRDGMRDLKAKDSLRRRQGAAQKSRCQAPSRS
jgi:hypothetical protein